MNSNQHNVPLSGRMVRRQSDSLNVLLRVAIFSTVWLAAQSVIATNDTAPTASRTIKYTHFSSEFSNLGRSVKPLMGKRETRVYIQRRPLEYRQMILSSDETAGKSVTDLFTHNESLKSQLAGISCREFLGGHSAQGPRDRDTYLGQAVMDALLFGNPRHRVSSQALGQMETRGLLNKDEAAEFLANDENLAPQQTIDIAKTVRINAHDFKENWSGPLPWSHLAEVETAPVQSQEELESKILNGDPATFLTIRTSTLRMVGSFYLEESQYGRIQHERIPVQHDPVLSHYVYDSSIEPIKIELSRASQSLGDRQEVQSMVRTAALMAFERLMLIPTSEGMYPPDLVGVYMHSRSSAHTQLYTKVLGAEVLYENTNDVRKYEGLLRVSLDKLLTGIKAWEENPLIHGVLKILYPNEQDYTSRDYTLGELRFAMMLISTYRSYRFQSLTLHRPDSPRDSSYPQNQLAPYTMRISHNSALQYIALTFLRYNNIPSTVDESLSNILLQYASTDESFSIPSLTYGDLAPKFFALTLTDDEVYLSGFDKFLTDEQLIRFLISVKRTYIPAAFKSKVYIAAGYKRVAEVMERVFGQRPIQVHQNGTALFALETTDWLVLLNRLEVGGEQTAVISGHMFSGLSHWYANWVWLNAPAQ